MRNRLLLLTTFALACGTDVEVVRDDAASDTTPAAPGADTATSVRDSAAAPEPALGFPRDSGTIGIVHRPNDGIAPVILRDVRTASHDGFDRVVLQFDGAALPGYHVEYIDRPVRQCGSGETVPMAGDAWLAIRLEPAYAHEGDTTVVATVRERNRTLELPNLRQLVLTCDFEAQVQWVLGLRSPNRYRVLELTNPRRLVVDVRH